MRERSLKRNLLTMAAVRFLFWMHFIAAVLVPFFREWARLSFTAILLIQAWFMLWSFLLEAPTGAIADRFGRKVSVALGGFVLAGATLLYASVPRVEVFLVGEALFACAMCLNSGADEALVFDTLKELGREGEATKIVSRLESVKLAGIVAGGLLGGVIASRFGVRAPMLAQGIPTFLAGLLALTLLVEPKGGEARNKARAGYLRILGEGVAFLRASPELKRLTVDLVLNAVVAWMILWIYQPQLLRSGVAIALFGAVHAGMCLGQIAILSHVEGWERLVGGRRRLALLFAALPPLCLLAMAASAHAALSIGLIVVAGTAGLARVPLFTGLMNERIPSERRATVLSSVSALRTLAVGLSYPVVGLLLDRSIPVALGAIAVAGIAVAWLARSPRELWRKTVAAAPSQSPTT